jgi:hypothetical protein
MSKKNNRVYCEGRTEIRAFKNKVLNKIFGRDRDGVISQCKRTI